ncbi:MAG: hypothetical protein CYPHOPRED_002714 [Cyphobasidiales sp. Tagirdzhanova-0007]|nr:MAG: hypothetical protein CYPHOPRED_002714 [Cyphobasidiales sp. Tagirdzhanova-0007]
MTGRLWSAALFKGYADVRPSGPLARISKIVITPAWARVRVLQADTDVSSWSEGKVSLELLTVFIGCPFALSIAYLFVKGNMARFPGLLMLSTGELYGAWMTFYPELVEGSMKARSGNFLYIWIYLISLNVFWVAIPAVIIVDSFNQIMGAFRIAGIRRNQ